ncbi:MAG: pirin family protein [Acidobacteria bacterium]|nr:pirin family protein [Acidobacteriota bacterium]
MVEGAGVRLKRSIAHSQLDYLDPFLLFDHFGSDNPQDYVAGFPMHPHRGIETVTYMLAGIVRHKDSLGNAGSIRSGDVQWMTAGRGIMHEEMPQPLDDRMEGFQLWVNLPAALKMTKPRYQDVPSGRIPEIECDGGASVKVIAGQVGAIRGPVTGIAADPMYLDVSMPSGATFSLPVALGHAAFAYIYRGEASFGDAKAAAGTLHPGPRLIVFEDGDSILAATRNAPARFLIASGKPLREPVARHGPFVMNTREEIAQALQDLREGTFVRE